ncbi:MAG: hypothetical protein ACKVZJ_02545 [Phycisphaerales bacterium]
MRIPVTALVLAAGCALSAVNVALAQAELPLTRITLYRSGVGSFERQGSIEGDQTVSLRFETEQVNDILKSLVLLDLDGGKVGAVAYSSQAPLERRLAGFEIDLSSAPSVDALFRAMRGAKVKLVTPDSTIDGTILNVENRKTIIAPTQGGSPGHFDEPYVTVVTEKGVRALAISRVSSFEFADPRLADELNKALAAIAEQRADRMKSVDLSFNGPAGKARRVVATYVHEMPVWKASYRVVLPGEKENKPLIQGWAIVENTTDTDWKNVSLSLASGRPVSFTMDLYRPVFGVRPSLPVPVPGALASRSYEDGTRPFELAAKMASAPSPASMAFNRVDEPGRRGASMVAGQAIGDAGAVYATEGQSGGAAGSPSSYDTSSLSSSAQAEGVEAGEQFLYTVSTPVTIERQRSAMIPIMGAEVVARRISIYNPNDGLKVPMRGLSMTNSTGLHLMPGPVLVFDAGVYAGDAQIPHTSRGASRLLAYALDLDVSARTENESGQQLTRITISNGTLIQKSTLKAVAKYLFDNRDASKGRTLIIEHPRRPGWTLDEPKAAVETTDSLHRFEFDLPAGKPSQFQVVETFVQSTTMAVGDVAPDTLAYYVSSGVASPAVADAIKKAGELQARVNDTRAQVERNESETREITVDQSRVRENMARIDRNSDLYARYMTKLGEQETRVEALTNQRTVLRDTLEKQQAELSAYLRDLQAE